jgi:ABC-2 type transport system ATP-binding protein
LASDISKGVGRPRAGSEHFPPQTFYINTTPKNKMIFPFFSRKKKPKALQTKKISFNYENQQVLKNLNIQIKQGKITALIGNSGSGKSTFLKLLAGTATKPHEGKIKILGKHPFFTKNRVGYVPQDLSLLPDLSIEDNLKIIGLTLGLSEKHALTKAKLLQKQLHLNEDLNKKPTELSGGQRARLNIILSALHDPDLLILDEPFVGLDFHNRRLLWHFLEAQKRRGKSILLTSHLLAETQQHADEIAIIRSGKIFFKGSVPQLQDKLKIKLILELKFPNLSKEKQQRLLAFCNLKDIKVLDLYHNYAMIGIPNKQKANALIAHFKKLTTNLEILSTREPNLDELFLTNE